MKKGFTLIELLAVIVILAILALIVSPIISGVISDAKKAAAERSMEGYVKAVEFAQVEYQGRNNGKYAETLDELTINYSGNTVSSPTVTFDQGIVKHAEADITTFHCVYDKGSGTSCSKGTTNEDTGEFAYIKERFPLKELKDKYGITDECLNSEDDSLCEGQDIWGYYDEFIADLETSDLYFMIPEFSPLSIENLIFTHEKKPGTGINISVSGDDSVIMYIVPNGNKVQGTEIDANDVYIYSEKTIKAPSDSTKFFADLSNLKNLVFNNMFDTSNVTNMNRMFSNTGTKSMLSLDLSTTNFDTSNVINMDLMFINTGYETLKQLSLGDKFDTSNVSGMQNMFTGAGNKSMTLLDLGSKFLYLPPTITKDNAEIPGCVDMFTDTGVSGCVIKVPSAIYQSESLISSPISDKFVLEDGYEVAGNEVVYYSRGTFQIR